MSFINIRSEEITFGIIVGNRGFFPSELANNEELK